MSKIGNYNLELQEQANELGFSTTQEALDNSYEVVGDTLVKEDEQVKAHEAWLEERDVVVKWLGLVYNSTNAPTEVKAAIKRAIEFIEKGEV